MNSNITADFLSDKTFEIKHRFLEMFTKLGIGHVTSAFSCAEITVVLWYKVLNYLADNPERWTRIAQRKQKSQAGRLYVCRIRQDWHRYSLDQPMDFHPSTAQILQNHLHQYCCLSRRDHHRCDRSCKAYTENTDQ